MGKRRKALSERAIARLVHAYILAYDSGDARRQKRLLLKLLDYGRRVP